MAFELISFDKLKTFLGLEGEAGDYPDLALLQVSVLTAIEEYIQRELEKKERVETVFTQGTPTAMVSLKGLPIATVASVKITTGAVTRTLNEFEYLTTIYGLKLNFKVKNTKVEVTYTGGEETAPSAIERAALVQVAYEFQSKDQVGATSTSTEGGTVHRPELGLLKETKRMLSAAIHPLKGTV